MDAINVPASVWLDGQWLDAAWMVETVDGESGELVITATVAGPGAPRVAALRMGMDLARELRAGAGFVGVDGSGRGAPCYDCRTTTQRVGDLETRMEQAEDTLSVLGGRMENDSDAVAHRLTNIDVRIIHLHHRIRDVERTSHTLDDATAGQVARLIERVEALEAAAGMGNLVWVDRVENRLHALTDQMRAEATSIDTEARKVNTRLYALEEGRRKINDLLEGPIAQVLAGLVTDVAGLLSTVRTPDEATAAQVARLIERVDRLEIALDRIAGARWHRTVSDGDDANS